MSHRIEEKNEQKKRQGQNSIPSFASIVKMTEDERNMKKMKTGAEFEGLKVNREPMPSLKELNLEQFKYPDALLTLADQATEEFKDHPGEFRPIFETRGNILRRELSPLTERPEILTKEKRVSLPSFPTLAAVCTNVEATDVVWGVPVDPSLARSLIARGTSISTPQPFGLFQGFSPVVNPAVQEPLQPIQHPTPLPKTQEKKQNGFVQESPKPQASSSTSQNLAWFSSGSSKQKRNRNFFRKKFDFLFDQDKSQANSTKLVAEFSQILIQSCSSSQLDQAMVFFNRLKEKFADRAEVFKALTQCVQDYKSHKMGLDTFCDSVKDIFGEDSDLTKELVELLSRSDKK